MGSSDRSKKRNIHQWKKAAIQFLLCFVVGFFAGFSPTGTASVFSGSAASYQTIKSLAFSAEPIENIKKSVTIQSLPIEPPPDTNLEDRYEENPESPQRELLTIITTTRSNDRLQEAFLRRLANTLRLAAPPLVWIVVEAHDDAPTTAKLLRETGIMYRHLTFKGNFTDQDEEENHQRNVALNHIERHRLNGIVHFAGMANTYHLDFFEEIREIEVFGTWPVATVSSSKNPMVVVEGPLCNSSKVVGWLRNEYLNNGTTEGKAAPLMANSETKKGTTDARPRTIDLSSFAFNSSILWDPERWGRLSSETDTSQDSIKFIQQVVLQDETKIRGIPHDCSRIMTWHLHVPKGDPPSPN